MHVRLLARASAEGNTGEADNNSAGEQPPADVSTPLKHISGRSHRSRLGYGLITEMISSRDGNTVRHRERYDIVSLDC